MTTHICPECETGRLKRSGRRGLLETLIYPFMGRYPWRCERCRARVFLNDRGAARRRTVPSKPAPTHSGTHSKAAG